MQNGLCGEPQLCCLTYTLNWYKYRLTIDTEWLIQELFSTFLWSENYICLKYLLKIRIWFQIVNVLVHLDQLKFWFVFGGDACMLGPSPACPGYCAPWHAHASLSNQPPEGIFSFFDQYLFFLLSQLLRVLWDEWLCLASSGWIVFSPFASIAHCPIHSEHTCGHICYRFMRHNLSSIWDMCHTLG